MASLYCYHLLSGCLAPLDERPAALLGRAAKTLVQGFVTHQAYVVQAAQPGLRTGSVCEARLRLLCALDLNPAAALLAGAAGPGFRSRWNAYNRLAPLGVNSQLDAQGRLRREASDLADAPQRQAAQRSAQTRAEVASLCAQALARRVALAGPPGLLGLASGLGCPAWLLELLCLLHDAPELSLAQAAMRLGRSPRQLQRDLATASLGFATLRQASRLQRAAQLLLGGEGHLTEVAHAVGFFDSAHFNRAWWRSCGLRPGQYRALAGLRSDSVADLETVI